MARTLNRLTARQVATIKEPGRHADGGGLYLVVDKNGAKKWAFIFRWKVDPAASGPGRHREMGLGSLLTVTLAEARTAAEEARRLVASGVDPIAARKTKAPAHTGPTFGEVADQVVTEFARTAKHEKHAAQWSVTLGTTSYDRARVRTDKTAHDAYVAALQTLRAKRVSAIDTNDVLAVLRPIWLAIPETASRIRGRIEKVLDAAKVKGLRGGDNPARWRGHLQLVLPRRPKASRGHHPAAPYEDVPAIVARLRAVGGTSAAALEFTILTCARTDETLAARWSEIDFRRKIWLVPGERMKGGRDHRVPLVDRAIAILVAMQSLRRLDSDYVFPGQRARSPLSQQAMAMALRRAYAGEATVHGMRSSFRDWVGDETQFPREVAEAALAHLVGDESEQAYRRGDALKRRRKLMEAWAAYCEPRLPDTSD